MGNAKYDGANCRVISLKLNIKTDADILRRIMAEKNKQGYIKALIRSDIAQEQPPKP